MKTNSPKQQTENDIELFNKAYLAAIEIYEPLGFRFCGGGKFLHQNLLFHLLPFFEREEESPLDFAFRSAFEAGFKKGLNQVQEYRNEDKR